VGTLDGLAECALATREDSRPRVAVKQLATAKIAARMGALRR
jgi:hypothetical protein